MANTYSQINIHAVFSVYKRENLLTENFRKELFKYMSGIMTNIGLFPLAVNGIEDHVHVFFEIPPSMSVSKALQDIKANSSKWINEKNLVEGKFEWQKGFGAFANSRSQRDLVIKYIINQEIHHKQSSFRDEYLALLKKYGIEYNQNYLFEFYVLDK